MNHKLKSSGSESVILFPFLYSGYNLAIPRQKYPCLLSLSLVHIILHYEDSAEQLSFQSQADQAEPDLLLFPNRNSCFRCIHFQREEIINLDDQDSLNKFHQMINTNNAMYLIVQRLFHLTLLRETMEKKGSV